MAKWGVPKRNITGQTSVAQVSRHLGGDRECNAVKELNVKVADFLAGRCTPSGTDDASRDFKILQNSSTIWGQTSRNFKELQREKDLETPKTALKNLEGSREDLEEF